MTSKGVSEGLIALLLAAVLVIAAGALGSGSRSEADLRATTYSTDRAGTRALRMVLDMSGVATDRLFDGSPRGIPPDRTVAVVAPSWPISRSDAAAMLDWAAAGGRLVVVEGTSVPPQHTVDAAPLLSKVGLKAQPHRTPDESPEGPATDGIRVRWPAALVLVADVSSRDPRAEPSESLVSSTAGDLAVRVPFGAGEVVAVSDAVVLSNLRLRDDDNAVLATRLLSPDGRAVVFDEHHHGWSGDGARGGIVARIGAAVFGTWPGRAFLVILLAALVFAAGTGVRLGAPLPEPRPSRRALREHADALGRLLESAGATREALRLLLDGVRRRVASRAGLAARCTDTELIGRLSASVAPGAAGLADAVAAASDAASRGNVKDEEFARLAAKLADARRRFVRGENGR